MNEGHDRITRNPCECGIEPYGGCYLIWQTECCVSIFHETLHYTTYLYSELFLYLLIQLKAFDLYE